MSRYVRVIHSLDSPHTFNVDVYCVLEAFGVTCPATAHAVKKLLCSGLRGHKDRETDLREALVAVQRAVELEWQRNVAGGES